VYKKTWFMVCSVLLVVVVWVVAIALKFPKFPENQKTNDNYTTLHLSPLLGTAIFEGMSPSEFCDSNGRGTFLEGKDFQAEIDKDGCLILSLDPELIPKWKDSFSYLHILQCVLGESRDIGINIRYSMDFMDYMEDADTCGFEISEDFTKIIASPDDNHWYFPPIAFACALMQVFEGKTCTEVRVEYMDVNEKGEVINTVVFPDENSSNKTK